MKIITNTLWVFLLTGLSLESFLLFAKLVPGKYALVVNFLLMPFVFGIAASWILQGPLYLKCLLLLLIPIVHVLLLGGDLAKPGLDRFLVFVEFGALCTGAITFQILKKFCAVF
jgi:hypothetical protein